MMVVVLLITFIIVVIIIIIITIIILGCYVHVELHERDDGACRDDRGQNEDEDDEDEALALGSLSLSDLGLAIAPVPALAFLDVLVAVLLVSVVPAAGMRGVVLALVAALFATVISPPVDKACPGSSAASARPLCTCCGVPHLGHIREA